MSDRDRIDAPAPVSVPVAHAARQRLVEDRWVLAVVAAILAWLVFLHEVPVAYALGAFAAVLFAATVMPRQRAVNRLAARGERARGLWPDTGMKVIVEALPQAGFLVDRRGIVRYVNDEAQQMFGPVRPGDPLSFRLRIPSVLEAIDRVSAGEPPERIRWSEKVPTERWLEAFVTRVGLAPADTGRAALRDGFILVVVSDLTEQRRLERMRADFVANASHELRTPLASLSGFIETLQGAARDDPGAQERFLQIMNDQAARMSRLIDDLLSLSRIEMRAHVRPDTLIDLHDVVDHVVDALTPSANEFGVAIETDLPDTPLVVRGDHDELVQVFENLVENAIKYGSDGERVRVSAVSEDIAGGDGFVTVSVRDWGPGIAREHLPRLTERFYRIDVASSREKKGTGLGLAIVKHILNRHRAHMTVDNAPGRGAVFTVRMARAKIPGADSKAE
ncbi:ATP-binding protein [Rhodobium gokarnense]|uniref:histidine kinase n=1 Tax=Rhodobium gokarnense TaxID=364296 RepID=A0ABT3H7N5_9HYPH|nr:ATP-binding protein [Rhodobium gokarnense]MCW2306412.1 two-component system phosphate regulon sensor histidine kinase PhoR [Rhodobium gokarnense]